MSQQFQDGRVNTAAALSPKHQALCAQFRADLPELLEGRDPFFARYAGALNRPRTTDEDCFEVLNAVCEAAGISRAAIMGDRLSRIVARPRQVAYALIRERHPDMMDAEIARFMRRHQTTIAHGLKMIRSFMLYEPETKRVYDEAKAALAAVEMSIGALHEL